MFKRLSLFLITNLAIVVVASIVLNLVGFGGFLDAQGINLDYRGLFIFSLIFGFAGSFVSLFLSKWMAKMTTGAKVIKKARNSQEQWLLDVVATFAKTAHVKTPEFAIFNSAAPNAFATGASKNKSLIAVSTGLLEKMQPNEVEAVIAHEMAHVANGDMITMTLLQGIINTFVIFFSRIAAFIVDRVILKNERGLGIGYYVTAIFFDILFGILASVITMWFSRKREFKADEGGAYLSSTGNMIAALERLQSYAPGQLPDQLAAFGISTKGSKIGVLFSSHPPLQDRIKALRAKEVIKLV